MSGKPRMVLAAALLAVAAAVALLIGLTRGGSEAKHPGVAGGTSASAAVSSAAPRAGSTSPSPFGPSTSRAVSVPPGMATVAAAQLPPEAQATLRRIEAGGPFPYSKDGTVFGNREGRLPKEKSGYYREYTVDTPGSQDRGARRIIAGNAGERYYTSDHYVTFRVILP